MLRYLISTFYLLLSKVKYHTNVYTPKPLKDIAGCVDYDFQVVSWWLKNFEQTFPGLSIRGKSVLELGPGADLGVAAILLAKGVAGYYAFDIHNLVQYTPPSFYDLLFNRISKEIGQESINPLDLRNAVTQYSTSGEGKVNYICKNPINFVEIADNEVDIIFSQAALEHFSDLRTTFKLLAPKCKPGSILLAEVDLKAHSRWVREHDPLSIYMYGDCMYKLLSHPASPNRVRPKEYTAILRENGWTDIRIKPIVKAEQPYFEKVKSSMGKFLDSHADILSFLLIARKK